VANKFIGFLPTQPFGSATNEAPSRLELTLDHVFHHSGWDWSGAGQSTSTINPATAKYSARRRDLSLALSSCEGQRTVSTGHWFGD
jgi:hypothetical protein